MRLTILTVKCKYSPILDIFTQKFSTSDRDAPSTQIHVMAGCQQPQACLRQQAQNNPITIGVAFYGSSGVSFGAGAAPTSRRNVREGLCRLGKDWTYYSGHKWVYDTVSGNAAQEVASRTDLLTAERANGHQFYDERESWYNGNYCDSFFDNQLLFKA